MQFMGSVTDFGPTMTKSENSDELGLVKIDPDWRVLCPPSRMINETVWCHDVTNL